VLSSICKVLGEPSEKLARHIYYKHGLIDRGRDTPVELETKIGGQNIIEPLLMDLVKKMLTLDYRSRITMENIKKHPYLHDCTFRDAQEETFAFNTAGYISNYKHFGHKDRENIFKRAKTIIEAYDMPDVILFTTHLFDFYLSKSNRYIYSLTPQRAELILLSCIDLASNYHLISSAPSLQLLLADFKNQW
jgi:serine/threonine protein kinase